MLYRTRTLKTKSGEIKTPTMFPVRNIGKKNFDNTPNYMNDIPDLNTAMVNSLAIRENNSVWNKIKNGKTIKDFVEDDCIVFADSGGFDLLKNGSDKDPLKIFRAQREMNSDIVATLDMPIKSELSKQERSKRIQKNIDYALQINQQHSGNELLFASIHGYDQNTIQNVISCLEKKGNFDGYAIGSLIPIMKNFRKIIRIILAARKTTDKHLHIFGLGGMTYQPLLLYLGVDSVDSSSYIVCGGNRIYFVPGIGRFKMEVLSDLEYLPCNCPVCSQQKLDEVKKSRNLITKHNLWALVFELRRFRYVVESHYDLENYLEGRFKNSKVMRKAFETAKQIKRGLL